MRDDEKDIDVALEYIAVFTDKGTVVSFETDEGIFDLQPMGREFLERVLREFIEARVFDASA